MIFTVCIKYEHEHLRYISILASHIILLVIEAGLEQYLQ
jgi:hypothetical protein